MARGAFRRSSQSDRARQFLTRVLGRELGRALRESTLPPLGLRAEARKPLPFLDLHLSDREVRAGQSSMWVVLQQETRCLFPVVSRDIAPCLIQKRRAMLTAVRIAGQEVHQAALHQFVARRFRGFPEPSKERLRRYL